MAPPQIAAPPRWSDRAQDAGSREGLPSLVRCVVRRRPRAAEEGGSSPVWILRRPRIGVSTTALGEVGVVGGESRPRVAQDAELVRRSAVDVSLAVGSLSGRCQHQSQGRSTQACGQPRPSKHDIAPCLPSPPLGQGDWNIHPTMSGGEVERHPPAGRPLMRGSLEAASLAVGATRSGCPFGATSTNQGSLTGDGPHCGPSVWEGRQRW